MSLKCWYLMLTLWCLFDSVSGRMSCVVGWLGGIRQEAWQRQQEIPVAINFGRPACHSAVDNPVVTVIVAVRLWLHSHIKIQPGPFRGVCCLILLEFLYCCRHTYTLSVSRLCLSLRCVAQQINTGNHLTIANMFYLVMKCCPHEACGFLLGQHFTTRGNRFAMLRTWFASNPLYNVII
jgi:hypothetical protein